MSLSVYVLSNLLTGIIALILFLLGYKVFDGLTPKGEFSSIAKKDKITNGGLIIAVFLFSLGLVIAFAVM